MIIQKVRIKNFRGFYGEKEILFDGKPFVLLSAPNGIGKTSVIDAIEWCLTGNIGRLKLAYDNRSTNSDERRKNLDGILKNKNANSNDYVEVELTVIDKNRDICLLRKQKKDDLQASSSEIMMDGSVEIAKKWLIENVGDSFYKYHFCNIQKSFEMQNRKRDSLPDLFAEFISDYSKEKIVADNLETYVNDIERYMDDLKDKLIAKDTFNAYEEQVKKYVAKSNMIDYPQAMFFKDEILQISQLDEAALNHQLQQLYSYGFTVAYSLIRKLVINSTYQNTILKLKEIQTQLTKKKTIIDEAIKNGLDTGNEKIEELSKKVSEYRKIELTKGNIRDYANLIIKFQVGKFTKEYYLNAIRGIDGKELYLKELDKEIEHLTKGNVILELFSELVAHRQEVVRFRDIKAKCPICGSEQFADIEEAQILSEADEYIRNNNETVLIKSTERKMVCEEIDAEYIELIRFSREILEQTIADISAKKNQYESLQKETTIYFAIRDSLLKIEEIDCTKEQLSSLEYVSGIIVDLKVHILSEKEQASYRQGYKSVLTLLGYKHDDEEEIITAERIKEQAKDGFEISIYSQSVFTQKVNAVKCILENKDYLVLNEKLKNARELNAQIKIENKMLEESGRKAEERSEKIRQLVAQLEQEEYAAVGPSLKKYYKKLSRIDSIDTIDIVLEDKQISMIDEKKKNIVNILSNGQLSVFMLSYFFAGITTRSKTEKCKVYFIDDLTACMDDVNMLAFLDLLKYQMLAKEKTMEQIFFVTCDDRICRLLRYKLEGCGIEFCELKEKDFA